jgi:cupin fold WbuC family metalloprotein
MKISIFYNADPVAEVDAAWYEKLKVHAYEADRKRARLCLHHSPDDPLHEMVIVFHRDTVIQPHRHRTKTESYHMVFGELDVVFFDEAGKPTRLLSMGAAGSGKTQIYRLSQPIWHSVIIRSEYACIHEVTNGPFREEENDFAPWAPEDPDALRAFLARAVEQLSPAGKRPG